MPAYIMSVILHASTDGLDRALSTQQSRSGTTVVIFQMAAPTRNEMPGATENPARWGSTDGAVQSKSSARFRMRCLSGFIHSKHDRKKTVRRHDLVSLG